VEHARAQAQPRGRAGALGPESGGAGRGGELLLDALDPVAELGGRGVAVF